MYVPPLQGSLSPNSLASPPVNAEADGTLVPGGAAPVAGDNISRVVPPWLNDGGAPPQYGEGYGNSGSLQGTFGSLMGVLQQLMQMLQSLMGYGCNPQYASGGCNSPYGSVGNAAYGNERYFQNATGSSNGDPHLSFNGTHWSNMTSESNLLNSDSFPGGFQVSTQVTPPNAKGVAWNQSATVSLNNGATTISMNNNGEPSITSYGQSVSIARGQTVQLGGGESVTYEQNGSLQVTAQNGSGGQIQSTLTPGEKGINVDVTAHDVDLGGALVHGYEERGPTPTPIPNPTSSPVPPVPIFGPMPTPVPISGPEPTPVPQPYPVSDPIEQGPQPTY